MIIGVINQKGGVGKTTLSLNLAAAYVELGKRVLLVDADPQASATTWRDFRTAEPLFTVVSMPTDKLHQDVPHLAPGYDVVVIDGAQKAPAIARSMIVCSDLVVIPVKPGAFDIWSVSQTVEQVRNAFRAATFVVTQKNDLAISRDIDKVLARFEDIPIQPTAIWDRAIYTNSSLVGETAVEQHLKKNPARDECINLARNLIGETA